MKHRARVYHGWWIVVVGTITFFLGAGIVWSTFGVFFVPLIEEFGWSRLQLSLATSIAAMAGIAGPLVGILVDKYGPRRVMVVGTLATGISFALLGQANSLYHFYGLYLVASIGLMGIVDIPIVVAVTDWFGKRRGLAMGIVMSGFGLGGLVMTPLSAFLISNFSWRSGYYMLGLGMIVVLLPLIISTVRLRPGEKGLLPDDGAARTGTTYVEAGRSAQEGVTLSKAMKLGNFWLVAAGLSLFMLGLGSVFTHAMPFFQDIGLSPETAATVMAVVGGISIASGLLAGYLADRFSPKHIIILSMLLGAVAIAILCRTDSLILALVFAVPFGLAVGAPFTLLPLIMAKYFGQASMGAIYGTLWGVTSLAFAAGPSLTGYIFDVSGSYTIAFIIFIATSVAAAILMCFVRVASGGQTVNP